MSDVEYQGLLAQTWDLLRGDTSGWTDRPFYLDVIREFGQPVLDVGCGTGRLLLDYLAEGIDIDGVDVSAEMLGLCHEKAAARGLTPTLYEQAMEQLALPRRYRPIIVPSSAFQLLPEPATARRALRRLRDHLRAGGALVMPFMAMHAPGEDLAERWVTEAVREDGTIVRRSTSSTFHPDTRLMDTEDVCELIQDGDVIAAERHVRAPGIREYDLDEAVETASSAGLEVVRVVGGFTAAPWTPAERVFTLVLRSKQWR